MAYGFVAFRADIEWLLFCFLFFFHEFFSGLIYGCLGNCWSVCTHAFFSLPILQSFGWYNIFISMCMCMVECKCTYNCARLYMPVTWTRYSQSSVNTLTVKGHKLQGNEFWSINQCGLDVSGSLPVLGWSLTFEVCWLQEITNQGFFVFCGHLGMLHFPSLPLPIWEH